MLEVSAEQSCSRTPDEAFPIVQRGLERALATYAIPRIEDTTMHWNGSPDAVMAYGATVTVRGGTVRVKLRANVEAWKRHHLQNGLLLTGAVLVGIAALLLPRYAETDQPWARWVLGSLAVIFGGRALFGGIADARRSAQSYERSMRKTLQDKLGEVMRYIERHC